MVKKKQMTEDFRRQHQAGALTRSASLAKSHRSWGPRLLRALNTASRFFLHNGSPLIKLDETTLLAKARGRTGLDDFGDDSFRQPLKILLRSFEEDADLNLVGRITVYAEMVRMLSNRLRLEEDCKRHPEILAEVVQRPLFITGLPRTGSTFLHALLAQDPANRTPRVWEVMYPSPPPESGSFDSDPRIFRTERELKWIDTLMPEFETVHMIRATYPQECIAITGHAFMSYVFESMYHVYSYRIWHDGQDKRPAYEFHRRFLQYLQWRCRGNWVLKAPSHFMALDALLQVYPDAEIVVTHRDPLKVLPSTASFSEVLREPFTNHLDKEELGREVSRRWEGSARFAIELLRGNADLRERFLNIHFSDLARNPLSVVRRIYEHLDRELTQEAEKAMLRFVAENPKDKNGMHRYSLEEFGLDWEEERNRFKFYTDYFGIASE